MVPDSYHSYSLFKAFLQVINNHHAKKKLHSHGYDLYSFSLFCDPIGQTFDKIAL